MSDLDSEYKLLKVFSQLYVGFKHQGEGVPMLGFATPFETNAAFEKRKRTVDHWADPGYLHKRRPDGTYEAIRNPENPAKIIDNEALPGFRISEEVRRTYWGGGNVVWRILDPRGFELEISSANLCRIIDSVGIQPGGVIPNKCLWGRLGPNNILVPEGSALWEKTIKDAEKMDGLKKTAKKGDYAPGDVIVTKSGDKRIYIGQFDVVCKKNSYDRGFIPSLSGYGGYGGYSRRETETALNISLEVVSKMYVVADMNSEGEPTIVHLYRSLKVVEVQGKYKGEKNLVDFVNDPTTHVCFAGRSHDFDHLDPLAIAPTGTVIDPKLHAIPVDEPDFGMSPTSGWTAAVSSIHC